LKDKNSEPQHFEFLAEAIGDPRKSLIERLLKHINEHGDILVYHQSFEVSRLREFGKLFPDLSAKIDLIIDRVKDLILPFKQKHYYHPRMKGRFSIKVVLPALVPGLSYDELDISEGRMAMNAFARLSDEKDTNVIEKTRQSLLAYCKMDTLAMVKIWQVLERV